MEFAQRMAAAVQLTIASPEYADFCRSGGRQDQIARLISRNYDAVVMAITDITAKPAK